MKILFACVFFCLCISCSTITTQYVEIEKYTDTKEYFPAEVVNVVIVDNTPQKYAEWLDFEKQHISDPLIFDTLKIDFSTEELCRSLRYGIERRNYFYKVFRHQYRPRENDFDTVIKPMTKDEIETICEFWDADAVIALDKYEIKEKAPDLPIYILTHSTNLYVDWQISFYSSSGDRLASPIQNTDTITLRLPYNKDGKVENYSLEDGRESIINGLLPKILPKIIPVSYTRERWFYNLGNKDAKLAQKAASQGDWQTAKKHWLEALENEKLKNTKARIMFNIALAEECLGNVEEALNWLKKSKGYLGKWDDLIKDIRSYEEILEQRIKKDK